MDIAPRQRIAAEVRAEMARHRTATTDLAEGTGIALTTLRRRLAGESSFTYDELAAIAGYFGITIRLLNDRAETQEIA